jgi:hypothetical protein
MRLFLAAAVLAFLAAPAAARATPVLGSPDYITSGAGWGTSAPHEVFNGGSPGGLVDHIKWRRWGKPVARGRGKANIYRPNGGYYPPVTTVLRARKLGTCPGRSELAYLVLELRTPNWPGGPLGPWLKWSGSRTLCDYDDTDPAYDYPKRPPGLCADIGSTGSRRRSTASSRTGSPASGHGRSRAASAPGSRPNARSRAAPRRCTG